jgi:hypothetical protein
MELSGQLHAPAALLPGKEPLVPIDRRLSGLQNRSGRGGEEKNSEPCWDSNPDHPIVRPVVSHYTDCAIPAVESRCLRNRENT